MVSEFMRRLTLTHATRWRCYRRNVGGGPVYQGRFRSFPVDTDRHYLTILRYVETNARRAGPSLFLGRVRSTGRGMRVAACHGKTATAACTLGRPAASA